MGEIQNKSQLMVDCFNIAVKITRDEDKMIALAKKIYDTIVEHGK